MILILNHFHYPLKFSVAMIEKFSPFEPLSREKGLSYMQYQYINKLRRPKEIKHKPWKLVSVGEIIQNRFQHAECS